MLGEDDAPSGGEVLDEFGVRVLVCDGDVVVVDDRYVGDALQRQQAWVAFAFWWRLRAFECPLNVLECQALTVVELDAVSDCEIDSRGIVGDGPFGCKIRNDRSAVGGVESDEVAVVALEALRSEPHCFGVVVPCPQGARNTSYQRTAPFAVGIWSHCGGRLWCRSWFGRFSGCGCFGCCGRLGCRWLDRYWRRRGVLSATTDDYGKCGERHH